MEEEKEIYYINADVERVWPPFKSIMNEKGLHMLHKRHFKEKIYFFASPRDVKG